MFLHKIDFIRTKTETITKRIFPRIAGFSKKPGPSALTPQIGTLSGAAFPTSRTHKLVAFIVAYGYWLVVCTYALESMGKRFPPMANGSKTTAAPTTASGSPFQDVLQLRIKRPPKIGKNAIIWNFARSASKYSIEARNI